MKNNKMVPPGTIKTKIKNNKMVPPGTIKQLAIGKPGAPYRKDKNVNKLYKTY